MKTPTLHKTTRDTKVSTAKRRSYNTFHSLMDINKRCFLRQNYIQKLRV